MPYTSKRGNQVTGVNFKVRVYPSEHYEGQYDFYLEVDMDRKHVNYLKKTNQLPDERRWPGLHQLDNLITETVEALERQSHYEEEDRRLKELGRIERSIDILQARYASLLSGQTIPIDTDEDEEDDDYDN